MMKSFFSRTNTLIQRLCPVDANFEASVQGEPSTGVSFLNLPSCLNSTPADPLKQLESLFVV